MWDKTAVQVYKNPFFRNSFIFIILLRIIVIGFKYETVF